MLTRIALGLVCFFGLIFAALLFFYAGGPWIEQRAIPVFGSRFYDSALFGIAGLFCIFVNIRLIQGKTWAWWTALAASVLTHALGVLICISALHPRDDFAASESGFGLGVSVILIAPATIASILLILPSVRRRFVFSGSKDFVIRVTFFGIAVLTSLCASGQEMERGTGPGATVLNRNLIIPLVAAHQHLLSPDSVPRPEPSLPEIKLPPELESLLQERSRASGSIERRDLFTENAMVLQLDDATWAHGDSDIQIYLGTLSKGVVYVPNAYGVDGSIGYIAGAVRKPGSTQDDSNFLLALQRDSSNKWHIVAETDTAVPPPEFTKPVTADQLTREMDDVGIQKGVVLSIAYWYGSPLHKPIENEYAKVRAENDWTAQQVARYPQRLVFFCGVNPLKEYAITELDRCAKMPQMKGMKLHFANSGVDLRNPDHLAKVQNFFRAANDRKVAIVVHIRSLRGDYGRNDAEIFIKDVLPVALDIPIQIAHLAGSGPGYGPDTAMATYAEAIASGDPRTKNLYFDVTNCVTLDSDQSQEELELIAKRLRQVGLKRIFFGSDMSTSTKPPVGLWWDAFRWKLPLTSDELSVIANNVPPYMNKINAQLSYRSPTH